MNEFPAFRSEFSVEGAVEEGLEQSFQTLAAGGLLGLHAADFRQAGGELLLRRKRWNCGGHHNL